MRLHHAAIICSSLENADRFYQEIVGLETIKTSTLDETLTEKIFGRAIECRVVLYGNENFAIEVFIIKKSQWENARFEHLCLEMEKREEFLVKCESHGLGVKRIPKGDKVLAFVEDFNGNLFEVKES